MFSIGFQDFKKLPGVVFSNFDTIGFKFEEIAGISTDTRTIKSGEVFWALAGDQFDGHAFLATAGEKGAKFAVVERGKVDPSAVKNMGLIMVPDTLTALQQLGRNQRMKYDIPVIAVTGSNGKTTVKEMIHHVLSNKMPVHKTEGNFNNHIGCPLTLLQMRPGHKAAVIEIGTNHPGEIAALAEICVPNQAVITDISGAHLEHFGNVEAVAKEKLSLFESLTNGSVIYKNMDNPFTAVYENSALTEVTYSAERKAAVYGKINSVNEAGCVRFSLNGKIEIQLQVSGVHNAKNALAASAVALQSGLSETEIRDALESFNAFSKRMQISFWNGIIIINDAYNANPGSMAAAFDTVSRMKKTGKLYLALGDMFELGVDSPELHRRVLAGALTLKPEQVFLMGSDFSDAAAAIGLQTRPAVRVFTGHEELAENLKTKLSSGDMLLVKGSRGMLMEKVIQFLTESSIN